MSDDDPIIFADADEARAWDVYVAGMLAFPVSSVDSCHRVADAMLRERRKRMRCDCDAETWRNYTPDPNDGGEMVVTRCTLPAGHAGDHKP
jgi:hypothetical protein